MIKNDLILRINVSIGRRQNILLESHTSVSDLCPNREGEVGTLILRIKSFLIIIKLHFICLIVQLKMT